MTKMHAFVSATERHFTKNCPPCAKSTKPEWIVMIEGSDPKATDYAARQAFKLAALAKYGVTKAPTIATYRLLFGNQR